MKRLVKQELLLWVDILSESVSSVWAVRSMEFLYSYENSPLIYCIFQSHSALSKYRKAAMEFVFRLSFLAHLSRRLRGELLVYQRLRRPSSVRPSVRQHFQTSSPLKPLGQLNSNFIWRLLRVGERKFVQMVLVT